MPLCSSPISECLGHVNALFTASLQNWNVVSTHVWFAHPEILATQFAEHVQIRKGHEQLSVPCDDIHGQKLPVTGTGQSGKLIEVMLVRLVRTALRTDESH